MPKINDLWRKVEESLAENTLSGNKMAILEAHKVLEAVLDAKGYPGKKIEKKLFWAGYSLKDKNGLSEAIELRNSILDKFEYQISDTEVKELTAKYKEVLDKVTALPRFTLKERLKMALETYFSPKTVLFWRNLTAFIGFFVIVKLLYRTEIGQNFTAWLADLADFVISWQFFILIVIVTGIIYAVLTYFAGKSKVVIKEDS